MKKFIQMMLLVSSMILVGCGGGGGSASSGNTSALVYNGKTTAAKLDAESVKSFVEFVLDSSSNQTLTSPDSTTNKVSKSFQKQSKVVNGTTGMVDFTTTTIDNVTTKIVAVFKNYSEFETVQLTGTVTYIITVDEPNSSVIKNMKTTLSRVTLKSTTSDVTMDGVMNISNDYRVAQSTITQNLVMRNNKTSESFKLENFVTLLDSKNRPLSYKGKVYHSVEGYVVISTPVKLFYTDGSYTPNVGGEILFEGDDSRVRERIAYEGTIRIEIDNGKNGTVDEFEVYNSETMAVISNRTPVVKITFPKEIFTNTELLRVKVNSYDPDLDEINLTNEWQVNDVVKSNSVSLDNDLFKKYDSLKLTIVAEDNRVGDIKSIMVKKEQEVLNSRPVITSSFSKISLSIGEEKELTYSVSDADNDSISISWKTLARSNSESLDEYINYEDVDCSYAIQKYNREHILSFSTLTEYEQEDFKNENCQKSLFQSLFSKEFIVDKTFTAVVVGFYRHEMIVTDGDYNRSKRLVSEISKMDLIESQELNHVPFTVNSTHSVYMEDMNNDDNKDLIYISGLYPFSEEEPVFVIEYRDGKTLLEKVEYNISNLRRYLDDYYIKDLDGDGRLDVLFVYSGENTSDNTQYGKMLQKDDGTFNGVEKFTLDNRVSLLVENIIGDTNEEIIIAKANNYSYTNEIKIYGEDSNQTLKTTLPIVLGHYILGVQLLAKDIDENGKKDIIVVNKNFKDNNNELNFVCSVLSQEDNGSFSETKYTTLLRENIEVSGYEKIKNVQIVDMNTQNNIWIVTTNKSIYFMKLEVSKLELITKLDFVNSKNYMTVFSPVDINRDGKLDIMMTESYDYNFVSVFIQKDDLEFLSEQNYTFTFKNGGFGGTSSILGDIDNDGKQELFVTTGEEELSVLYFK